jgi:hypothetical protein
MRSEGRYEYQTRLSSRRQVAFAILIADGHATHASFGTKKRLPLRLGVRFSSGLCVNPGVIWAGARLQRPELRLVLSLPAAVLLLERLQRFLRRRDDGALQRL